MEITPTIMDFTLTLHFISTFEWCITSYLTHPCNETYNIYISYEHL